MARRISKETIAQVEKQTDIVSLVGEYVALEERGRDYWGCCPFHKEDTPSFHVEPDTGFYYCFGCHAAGKAIKFIEEMEKVSYPDAVLFLAKRAGIEVVYDTNYYEGGYNKEAEDEKQKKKDAYIDLYERVSKSLNHLLTKDKIGRAALSYAYERGLTNETIKKFRLGFAPSDIYWMRRFLRSKSFSEEFLDGSGLFSKKHKDIAFFSNRLMFPIFDRFGKVVAFGGRDLSNTNSVKNEDDSNFNNEKILDNSNTFVTTHSKYIAPKYLNSGDLIQYKKGETLYAFNFAKDAIRENKRVIFCEGYMDCIAYHQCGVNYAVAPLGTALTDDQIKMVKPFVKEVLLGFDNDGAGLKATKRAILMLRKADIPTKVIQITGGKDPAEIMVKSGENAQNLLTKIVENAIIDSKFLLATLTNEFDVSTASGKRQIAENYFPYIRSLQSVIERDATIAQLADDIGLTLATVRADYQKSEGAGVANRDFNEGANKNNSSELNNNWQDGDYNEDNWDTDFPPDDFSDDSNFNDFASDSNTRRVVSFADIIDEKIIGKLSNELKIVIIFINAIADDENAHKFDYIFNSVEEGDFEDESARTLFNILKNCYKKGETSLLQIRDACLDNADKCLSDIVMMKIVIGEYENNREVAVKSSIKRLKIKSLERKRDDLQKRITNFRYLTPDDKIALKEIMQNKREIDAQINALGEDNGSKRKS